MELAMTKSEEEQLKELGFPRSRNIAESLHREDEQPLILNLVDFESSYEVSRVADFILSRNFRRVALQFPDELLKDSIRVVSCLRRQLLSSWEASSLSIGERKNIGLYVMADTTYGSCCVDEVGASHVNADCVIHYGHTCLSLTSTLPALFVFGKTSISPSNCAVNISNHALNCGKPILILFGLEYAYAMQNIKDAVIVESTEMRGSESNFDFCFADVRCSVMDPLDNLKTFESQQKLVNDENFIDPSGTTTRFCIGGLSWSLPEGRRMEDYAIFWIGPEDSAFSNVVLTFNVCEIVRYDPAKNCMVPESFQQKRILKRRYYLVEKAKDANIIGILVGTLGVAGYLQMIHQMKELIIRAGKKAYTFVMGRPNPAKLANFPECDVFIHVSCPQTALLDCKEFLAPVITPFEATLAFSRGSQWTGAYVMEFRDLVVPSPEETPKHSGEARFSFLQGGYVEDTSLQENGRENKNETLTLVNTTEKAMRLRNTDPTLVTKGIAKSGTEFFVTRSFQGLDIHYDDLSTEPVLMGRSGRASGYAGEKINR